MTRVLLSPTFKQVYIFSTCILALVVALSNSYKSYYQTKVNWRYTLPQASDHKLNAETYSDDDSADERLSSKLEGRIAGGYHAKYGKFPFQAYMFNGFDRSHCGGTLVSINDMRVVVTAAHCIWVGDFNSTNPVLPKYFKITLGDINLLSVQPFERHYNVTRVVIHEYFDPRYLLNDIALVFLSAYVKNTTGEQPIDLPEKDFAPPESVTMSGFGISQPGASDRGILKAVTAPLFDWDRCKRQVMYLTNNHFCTVNEDPRKFQGHCFGDSGGPAVSYNYSHPGKFYLYGVISFSPYQLCGRAHEAQVYTRVSKYIDWIHGYALSHKAYCGTGHPILDPPHNYPKCPWKYDNPCWYYEECVPYP